MKAHGSTAAAAVRSSCDGADAARNWLESGLAFAGDMLLGAFESLKETSDFITNIQYGFLIRGISDLSKLATGELTQEEWMAKTALPAQEAKAVMNAAYSDPKAFGGAVVESLFNVDKFKDEPAKAIGGLLPDVALAALSGGSSEAASVASKTASSASRTARSVSRTAKEVKDAKGRVDTAAGDAKAAADSAKAMDQELDAKRRQAALDSVDDATQDSHPDGLLDMADSL